MATRTQILITARDGASSVFGKVAKSSTKAQKRIFGVNSALKNTDKTLNTLGSSVKGLVVGAGAVFGLGALANSLKEAVAVKVEYDKINNVLKAVTGSSKAAAEEFSFLSNEAERLGLELRPLAQSYTRLSAAGQQLGLSTQDTREIFTSFSEALTGFGATREQSIRVFTAIEQILSKGKVSAEELRQQLGEALPGAFQLAAKAAGVTVQELDGLLKNGELLSSEFILPFARTIRQEFGGAAVEGAKLLNAEFGRTLNVLDKVKLAFIEGGESGSSLADSLARILKGVREFLQDEERLRRIGDFGSNLGVGLELAAKSIKSIASTLSNIPIEALAAIALVSKVGRGGGTTNTTKLGAGLSPLQNATSVGALALQQSVLNQSLTRNKKSTGLPFSFNRGALDLNVTADFEKAIKTTTRGVRSIGTAFINVLGPVNSLALAAGALVGSFKSLQTANKEAEFFTKRGRQAQFGGAASVAFSQARAAGITSLEGARPFLTQQLQNIGAFDPVSQGGASFEQLEKIREAFESLFEVTGKVTEAVKSFIDPTKAVISEFSQGTEEIKQYTEDVKNLGVERAKELQSIREATSALEKKDIVEKEARGLAEERAKAQREANKAEETAKRAREAAKSAKDFQKGTLDLQKENAARAKGASEAAIDAAKRLRDYRDALISSGVAAEEASKLARERVKAENERAKQLKKPESRTLESRAVGVARSARSVEVATQKQQRIEDQRFRQSQDLLTRIADSLGNIEDNNNNLSIGIL